nr:hypothetical protein [Tanacetum cinerariifolium]
MMLDSIDNGSLVYPTVEENRQTQPKKNSKLTEAQQLQDDCDVQATNIILYSLPPNVYALVNHQEAAKDIWDRVKLLTKGTELSYQEYSGHAVPTFQQGDDPIECINKAMAFLSVVASRFPPLNNQLKMSSNPRNQRNSALIQTGHKVLHGFKETLMLVEAQEAGQILDEEQLAFIADPGIEEVQVSQQKIPSKSAFQTKDLDAYNSDVMIYPRLKRF